MNGTAEEALLWRIGALREALYDVRSCADAAACRGIATNALSVDTDNAAAMAHKLSPRPTGPDALHAFMTAAKNEDQDQ